jgi:hypothetical protein
MSPVQGVTDGSVHSGARSSLLKPGESKNCKNACRLVYGSPSHRRAIGIAHPDPGGGVTLKDTDNGVERFLSLDEERSLRKVLNQNIEA